MTSKTDYILLIASSNVNRGTGGIERYIKAQLDEYLARGISCYTIFPIRKKFGCISMEYLGVMDGYDFIGICTPNNLYYALLNSDTETVGEVYIHSLLNWNSKILQGIIEAIRPRRVSFYIHDYYSICVQYNLLRNGRYFCGDSKVNYEKCSRCKYYKSTVRNRQVTDDLFGIMSKYDLRFIAPSETAKRMFEKSYPQYCGRIIVIPHLIAEGRYIRKKKSNMESIKIAFVGAQTISKGWEDWLSVSDALLKSGLPYKMYYFGEKEDSRLGINNIRVSTTMDGKNAMVDALRENDIDVTVLWSIWPETYGYTFFESQAAGCFVVTTKDSGNMAHMINQNGNGIVLDNSLDSLTNLLLGFDYLKEKVTEYFDDDVIVPLGYRDNIPCVDMATQRKENKKVRAFNTAVQKNTPLSLIVEKLYKSKYSEYLKR